MSLPDWDSVIAHVCHMTGWQWDYVEETLTVARLKALHAEWERHPPVPIVLAALAGVKPREYGTADELVQRLRTMGR